MNDNEKADQPDDAAGDGLNMAALLAAMGSAGAAPTEANADIRTSAAQLWQMGIAYVQAGFNDQQAVYLLGQMLHGGAIGSAIAAAIEKGCES